MLSNLFSYKSSFIYFSYYVCSKAHFWKCDSFEFLTLFNVQLEIQHRLNHALLLNCQVVCMMLIFMTSFRNRPLCIWNGFDQQHQPCNTFEGKNNVYIHFKLETHTHKKETSYYRSYVWVQAGYAIPNKPQLFLFYTNYGE